MSVAEAVARGHGEKGPPVSGLRQPRGEGMGGETEKEGAADTAWWQEACRGAESLLRAPLGGGTRTSGRVGCPLRVVRLHGVACEAVDGPEAGVGQGTQHHHVRVHQGGCERAAGSREEMERHLGERREGPMARERCKACPPAAGAWAEDCPRAELGPRWKSRHPPEGCPPEGWQERQPERGFLGLPEGSGNMAKTAVGKSQLWVLEHSVGPRPLLSGIEIWGVTGLATLSVCPSACVCPPFPCEAPREASLSCPGQRWSHCPPQEGLG